MGELNYTRNATYETEAPDIPGDENKRIPVLLHTSEHIVLDNAAQHSLTVYRTEYYLSLRNMAQDFELTLTAADNTPTGAMIFVDFANAAGEESPHTLAVKAGGSTVATVATSTETTTACALMYTGAAFVLMGGTPQASGEENTTPQAQAPKTVTLTATLQDGQDYSLGGNDDVDGATLIQLGLDTTALTSGCTVNLSPSPFIPAEGAIIRINGESALVTVYGCSGLTDMDGIEAAYAIMMNGEWRCLAKVEPPSNTNNGQGSIAVEDWSISNEQSKTVGGGSESEVQVIITDTCGGTAYLTYGGTPQDGYKLYLTNADAQNNTADTVDVHGLQIPLGDLHGTRVLVYYNGKWN